MKGFVIMLLASCSLLVQASAIIVEAPNLERFENEIQNVDEHSLVLFDVDDTLLISKDLVLRRSSREIWNKCRKEILCNPALVSQEKNANGFLIGQIFSKMEYEVVDPKVIDIIDSLQKKGIRTIALTNMATGKIGTINAMEDWRVDHLKKHNIDFSLAFPQFKEVSFKVDQSEKFAIFKQGLLCTNAQEKGPVLAAFLETIEWRPSKVLLIDNDLDYLKSVEAALGNLGIEFIGFHYTEMKRRACVVDEDLAKYQIAHLAKTDEWLSDSEALKLVKDFYSVERQN